jgi:radical SAM protein with 4Fe4S-binding SPASM domain
MELALRSYAGEKLDLCLKCRAAAFSVKKILDLFVGEGKLERSVVLEYLSQPMWRKGLSSVLEGIALYGPRKPFIAASPFLVVWNFTRLCNLRCIHCYENAKERDDDELSTEQALQAVDRIADAGIAYIALSGGEPLMRKDFFEIAERIRKREMAFSIASNGTLISRETAKKLKKAGCLYAQISVDGANPETHNAFRGVNSFERTVLGIKNLVAEGINVGISSTMTRHNLDELPPLLDLAEELGVAIFMAYNFIPTGRGKQFAELDPSPREREELLSFLSSQQGKRKVKILSTAPQYSRLCTENGILSLTHFDVFGGDKEAASNISFLAEFVGGCGVARLYAALEPNGDIKPCVFIPMKLGNILKNSFVEVWRRHPILVKMRKRQKFKGNCGKCENRNICGGCRARAFSYFNDVQGFDPGCVKNEAHKENHKAEAVANL